jgi:hypothetical protein
MWSLENNKKKILEKENIKTQFSFLSAIGLGKRFYVIDF